MSRLHSLEPESLSIQVKGDADDSVPEASLGTV